MVVDRLADEEMDLFRSADDAVRLAWRVLEELEAARRGRVDRMADLLARVPGPAGDGA